MKHACSNCGTGVYDTEVHINASNGLILCVYCSLTIDAKAPCYICKQNFTLDKLYVTTRDFMKVEICKPCSLDTKVHWIGNFATEAISEEVSGVTDGITLYEGITLYDGTTWTVPANSPVHKNTWKSPPYYTSRNKSKEIEPETLEAKPRKLKIK
jgi:hypothetical protein